MNITQETPRAEITIKGGTFLAPEPYAEGHVLTANEASAMNQLLHENLRNNFAKKVELALEEVSGKVADLDMETLQAAFDEYAQGYEFGVRKASTRTAVDPVERELYKIAGALVRKALRSKGVDLKTVSEEQFDTFVESAIAARPQLRDEAVAAVESKKRIAAISIEA